MVEKSLDCLIQARLTSSRLPNKVMKIINGKKIIDIIFDRVSRSKSLRKIINNLDYKKTVSGGDNNASRLYLLNLQKLFSSDVIKAFKGKESDVA